MKRKNYLLPKSLRIKGISFVLLLVLGIVGLSCRKEQFKWVTKTKNTLESIEEKDSLLILGGVSTNSRYGYSSDVPIKLGVTSINLGETYPEKYFKSITGPKGETLTYERVRSCCPFKTVNSDPYTFKNVAVLEIYKISYEGLKEPIYLYVNFFDEGKPQAPMGFLPKL